MNFVDRKHVAKISFHSLGVNYIHQNKRHYAFFRATVDKIYSADFLFSSNGGLLIDIIFEPLNKIFGLI